MDSALGTALSGLFGTVVALALVLGIAWFALKAMRQWQDGRFAGKASAADHQLRFVRALPVGQREQLMLVEARGELMLIGVAAGSVRLLHNWGKPNDMAERQAEETAA
jgi:flagellar protein FliO/FliZ